MIEVMAACIMRGVQPLLYRGHPMRDFNGEDDATCHGRKGPDSAAALIKILSALYKGEEEDNNVQSSKLGKQTISLAHPFSHSHS